MRQLNGMYTQEFNRMHHRIGHVFQDRYTGILVEKENHLIEVARYVVLTNTDSRFRKIVRAEARAKQKAKEKTPCSSGPGTRRHFRRP